MGDKCETFIRTLHTPDFSCINGEQTPVFIFYFYFYFPFLAFRLEDQWMEEFLASLTKFLLGRPSEDESSVILLPVLL